MKEYIVKADHLIDGYGMQAVGELIRCKDCKHYSKEDEICLDMFGGSCNEDGYCAWAERKGHD